MNIAGIVKNSFVDYPHKLSFVIFTSLCNYDCFYCHNRDIIKENVSKYSESEVLDLLKKKIDLIEAVVITGGEPTLQNGLITFIKKVKDMGFYVKLDSNGSNPKLIEEIIKLKVVNYFAIDYKAPKDKYVDICGVSADNVLKTIDILRKYKVDFEVRTTVAPTLTIEDLDIIKREIGCVPKYTLNKYRIPEFYKPEDEKRIHEKTISF